VIFPSSTRMRRYPVMLKRKSRSMRALLTLVLAPAIIGGVLTAGLVAGPASPAMASTKVTICLKSSKSFCADVKDSKDVSGQPVWLYSASGSKDDHWIEVPPGCLVNNTCDPRCQITECVAFEDAQNTSLCLAASPSNGIELMSCGNLSNGGILRALWLYDSSSEMRNVFTGSLGGLTAFSPLAAGNSLFNAAIGQASGEWQKWTGPVVGG
jgi:hypothetical protein